MATSTQRPHALIIEDDLVSALGLQTQLADLGFRSFAYASAERQALEQAKLKCPDLVTVDVGLLDGSGLDAIEAILSSCGPLPVIYVTGDPEAVGLEGVVVDKPVSDHDLARAITRARAAPQKPGRADRGRMPAADQPYRPVT